jgi:hypothetical protein
MDKADVLLTKMFFYGDYRANRTASGSFGVFLSFCQRPPLWGGETPKIFEGKGGYLDKKTKIYMFTI